MNNIFTDNQLTNVSNESILKKIFDKYANDTITDEQISRILEPVFIMIYEGEFDRKRSKFSHFIHPILSLAAVLLIVFFVSLTQLGKARNNRVIIKEQSIPLTSTPTQTNTLKGKVISNDMEKEGVEIQLVDSSNMTVTASTLTDSEGTYEFSDIPNGLYNLQVVLSDEYLLVNSSIDSFTVVAETPEILFNGSSTKVLSDIYIKKNR